MTLVPIIMKVVLKFIKKQLPPLELFSGHNKEPLFVVFRAVLILVMMFP